MNFQISNIVGSNWWKRSSCIFLKKSFMLTGLKYIHRGYKSIAVYRVQSKLVEHRLMLNSYGCLYFESYCPRIRWMNLTSFNRHNVPGTESLSGCLFALTFTQCTYCHCGEAESLKFKKMKACNHLAEMLLVFFAQERANDHQNSGS